MLLGSKNWYETAYRRAVIDMHIPDWDDKFLSEFNAETYCKMLARARAQSVVAYAQSHVGLFNYPTKVGQQHRGLKGRNILAEVIDGCHKRKIAVVIYTSLIFDRWAADQHPEWQMVTHEGKPQGEGGRHGVLCPNSPYREYVRSFVEEICTSFDFEGIRFDMTLWPSLCYCQHCQKRFADEVGGELPRKIDWFDPKWVAFQRRREAWLVEFAEVATSTVRKLKPAASVEHQSSTYPLNWQFGVTAALTAQNDFLQGDFYGDSLQGSFVRKLLEDLTPNRPFGYETSFSTELRDHTTMKSEELLEAKASAAIADGAGFIFIDAIDPIGTLNPTVYERMGRIFLRLVPYYPHIGGQRVADIGIFYSLESKFNFATNGRPAGQQDLSDAHTASSMQAASRLIGAHLPFCVITKQSLAKLDQLKLLILSGVNMMDTEEVEAIRAWVRGGGTLVASGCTSLVNKDGQLQKDFMLGDVFGVSIEKPHWQEHEHYIAPTAKGEEWFLNHSSKYPAYITGPRMQFKARSGAEVLATTSLPWPAPDGSKFSSIHSNPPWKTTDEPALVTNEFGKGNSIYCGSLMENVEGLTDTYATLLLEAAGDQRFLVYRSNDEGLFAPLFGSLPRSVEMTVFHQPDRHRYVVSLVNFQKEMPNIPLDNIVVALELGDEKVHRVVTLPFAKKIDYETSDGVTTVKVPRLKTLAMFAVETM